MIIPKVKFLIDRDADSKMIIYSMRKYFLEDHPDVEKSIRYVPEEQKVKMLSEYISDFYAKNIDTIEKKRAEFQSAWDAVNDGVMQRLSKIMGTDWYDKDISAIMTLNKICPRDLKELSFFVSYFTDSEQAKGIVLHEITHFLFFKKWREVFIDYDEKQFDFPHLIWKLSEIVVEPIDQDEELKKLVPKTASAYASFHHTFISDDKEDLVEHFRRLYIKNIESGNDFSEFLWSSYKEITKLASLKLLPSDPI